MARVQQRIFLYDVGQGVDEVVQDQVQAQDFVGFLRDVLRVKRAVFLADLMGEGENQSPAARRRVVDAGVCVSLRHEDFRDDLGDGVRGVIFGVFAEVFVVVLDQILEDVGEEVVFLPEDGVEADVRQFVDEGGAEGVALFRLHDVVGQRLEEADGGISARFHAEHVAVLVGNGGEGFVENLVKALLRLLVEQGGNELRGLDSRDVSGKAERQQLQFVLGKRGKPALDFRRVESLIFGIGFAYLVEEFVVEEFIEEGFGDDFVFVAAVAEAVARADGFQVVDHQNGLALNVFECGHRSVVPFVDVFLRDERAHPLDEGEVGRHGEAGHALFEVAPKVMLEKGGIVEQGVVGHDFSVGLRLDGDQEVMQAGGGSEISGEAFMHAHEFPVAAVAFGEAAVRLVFVVHLAAQFVEGGLLLRHFPGGHFLDVVLAHDAPQFFEERDVFGVFLVHVALEFLHGSPPHFHESVGNGKFFLGDFPKAEFDVRQREAKQGVRVVGVSQRFFLVDNLDAVFNDLIQFLDFRQIEFRFQVVVAKERGQVVEFFVKRQRAPEVEKLRLVFDGLDFFSEFLGVFGIESEKPVFDEAKVGFDFFLRLEDGLIAGEFLAKLGLQLPQVGLVRLVEGGANICEVHDVAVAHFLVGTVDTGERLQEIVLFDDAPEVELFEARRVEARQEHLIDDENICLAFLEGRALGFEFFLVVADGGENEVNTVLLMGFDFLVNGDGLLRGIADDHRADGGIVQQEAAFLKVGFDVFDERAHIVFVRVNLFLFESAFFDLCFQFGEGFFQRQAVFRLYAFANQAQGVAVGDGVVVVIPMNVRTEDVPRLELPDERRARQGDHDGVAVGGHETRKERTVPFVVAVGFVDEIDALNGDVILRRLGYGVLGEFLDVDDVDGEVAGVRHTAGGLQVLHESGFRADFHDGEAAGAEFFRRLLCEVESIDDEVKTRDAILLLVIVGQVFHVVESERRLAAALRVPDHAAFRAARQGAAQGEGGEKLRVAHDVFFERLDAFRVGPLDVSEGVTKEKEEPLTGKQRSEHAVRRGERAFVGFVFRRGFDGDVVRVPQDFFFRGGVKRREALINRLVLLAETAEKKAGIIAGGIKSPRQRRRLGVVVFAVVGKDHDLRDVGEAAVFFLREPPVDTVMLRLYAPFVVWNLDFDEGQRQAVDKERDVGAETVCPALAWQFGDDLEAIVFRLLVVDEAQIFPVEGNAALQFREELPPQIRGVQKVAEVADDGVGLFFGQRRSVDAVQRRLEAWPIYVRVAVELALHVFQ